MYFSAEYYWGVHWYYERKMQTQWEVEGWIWDGDTCNRVHVDRRFKIWNEHEKFITLHEAKNLHPWLQCDLKIRKTFGHWQAHPGCCTVEGHIKGQF